MYSGDSVLKIRTNTFRTGFKRICLQIFLLCIWAFTLPSHADTAVTKVAMLGTGTPNPFPERSGPGVAVVVNDEAYLVDFGPGIVRRAAALSPEYLSLIHIPSPRDRQKSRMPSSA